MNNDVQYFLISSEEEGQRLDNYLLRKLKGVPKSFIYKIIRGGEVRVNKKRAKPLARLKDGDAVRVPPVRTRSTSSLNIHKKEQYIWLENYIIHEEDAYLVLNKPAGLAVHGGSGVSLGIIEILQLLRPECRSLELGHRLDKETSGCLVVAKKRSFLRIFHELLREKKVEKEYAAILSGVWKGQEIREVNQPLLKNIAQSGERVVKISPEGKPAKTIFTLIQNFVDACLVRANPLTGRTHQIRVHALYLGQPILGDTKYGKNEINKIMEDRGCPRLCLHAKAIRFTLPGDDGITCYFEAPLDEKMQKFIKNLNTNTE